MCNNIVCPINEVSARIFELEEELKALKKDATNKRDACCLEHGLACPIHELKAQGRIEEIAFAKNMLEVRVLQLEAKLEDVIHGELVACPLNGKQFRCKKYPKCVEVQACCYPGGRRF